MGSPLKTAPKKARSVQNAGLSMVELIVAMTIFIIVVVTGLEMMQSTALNSKKVEMKEALYTQLGFAMKELTASIERSGLDYEEYYSRAVVQSGASAAPPYTFGENYGLYHQQFFNLADPTSNVYGYDTGTNPYQGNPAGDGSEAANALCAPPAADCNTAWDYAMTEELFLVNAEGTERLFYVLEPKGTSGGYTLSKVELEGSDENQDGLIETWHCKLPYVCNGPATLTGFLPSPADLTDSASASTDTMNFIPILSNAIVIDRLAFILSPIEDPFKAYAETSSSLFEKTQIQPNVTIQITAHYQTYDGAGNPVGSVAQGLPEMTLQTTVKTGVNRTLETYAP